MSDMGRTPFSFDSLFTFVGLSDFSETATFRVKVIFTLYQGNWPIV